VIYKKISGVGMKVVKGRYVDGVVKLEERVEIEGEREVYVLFPEVEVKGIKAKELFEICGLVDVGGDAIKDSEDVYNE
jgi:hypothetical protein